MALTICPFTAWKEEERDGHRDRTDFDTETEQILRLNTVRNNYFLDDSKYSLEPPYLVTILKA